MVAYTSPNNIAYLEPGDPPNLPFATKSMADAIQAAIVANLSVAPATYTPAWSSPSGASPSVGASPASLAGKFSTAGAWRDVDIFLTCGSGTTYGSVSTAAGWRFTLPGGSTPDLTNAAFIPCGAWGATFTTGPPAGGPVFMEYVGSVAYLSLFLPGGASNGLMQRANAAFVELAAGNKLAVRARFRQTTP